MTHAFQPPADTPAPEHTPFGSAGHWGTLARAGVHNPFRDFDFDRAAEESGNGWDAVAQAAPKEAEAFHRRFRQHVQHATPAIMVPGHALHSILESGRIKSQFETGTSGGVNSRAARASAERRQFGYPADHPDDARPVYGYLTHHPYTDDSVDVWGPHTLVLDKGRIAHRTTWTGHDSLDHIAHITPTPLNHYRHAAVPLQTVGLYAGDIEDGEYEPEDLADHMRRLDPRHEADRYWRGDREASARYPEAQFHGGLHLGDISHVILRSMGGEHGERMGEDAAKHAAALTRAGIPWVHTGRFVPPTADDPWFTPRHRETR